MKVDGSKTWVPGLVKKPLASSHFSRGWVPSTLRTGLPSTPPCMNKPKTKARFESTTTEVACGRVRIETISHALCRDHVGCGFGISCTKGWAEREMCTLLLLGSKKKREKKPLFRIQCQMQKNNKSWRSDSCAMFPRVKKNMGNR